MNLSSLIQDRKYFRLFNQLGTINACLYLSNRLANIFPINLSFNKYYFVAQLLNKKSLLPESKGQHIQVFELPYSATTHHPSPRSTAKILNRYKQGAVCLVAYKNNDFAGCLWYAKSRFREDDVRCLYELVSDQTAWDFDVYVKPKFRLSPVFLKLWDTTSAKLLSEGCLWSLSRISAFNAISLSSHKRMGAKVIGWAVFTSLGTLQITIASIRPFLHISFSEASFPIFKLHPPQS